jgi:hypothetical protein
MDVFFATTRVELVWFDVAMAEANTFDECDAFCGHNGENFAGRAFVAARDYFDDVIFSDTAGH